MAVQILAGILLVALLWGLFRYALALRYAKLVREETRAAEESRGRRVVAELPRDEGDLLFFLEDGEGFYWGGREARKRDVLGARMLLNGAVVAGFSVPAAPLPDPPAPESLEGRERWEVVLYLRGGGRETIGCGSLREGVSREIATRVFGAVKGSVEGPINGGS